jgi:hypothetical protein
VYRPHEKPVVAQAKMAGPLQLKSHPTVPQVCEPRAARKVVQAQQSVTQQVGQGQAALRLGSYGAPLASGTSYSAALKSRESRRVGLPSAVQSGIQLSKKGQSGGKGGFGYTSGGLHYDKEKVEKAQQQTGVKPKGHGKGTHGSGESTQTKNDNKKVFAQLRANDEKEKTDVKLCREFHAKKKNEGKKCPVCKVEVD